MEMVLWRGQITAILPLLKSGVLTDMWVRIPPSPPRKLSIGATQK